MEEERRRQEALEEERKRLEKERQLENGGTSGDITENGGDRPTSFSGLADYNKGEAENEIQKLSQMVEQINPKLQENNEQVDLDQLFHFLSNEVPDSVKSGSIRSSSVTGSSETPEKSSILDEIDRYVWFADPQCGNFMIFVSFRFYVKSILRILEVQNQPFYHI